MWRSSLLAVRRVPIFRGKFIPKTSHAGLQIRCQSQTHLSCHLFERQDDIELTFQSALATVAFDSALLPESCSYAFAVPVTPTNTIS